jgi:hypothetical protein
MNKYLPLFFTLLTIFGNYYIPILNKSSVKEISNNNKFDAQPAGWTFSIWGIIYMGLLFISYNIFTSKLKWNNKRTIVFILSCVFNLLWMYSWTKNKKNISQVLLFLIVISLSYLWILNIKSNDNIVQNIIMMYIAWTLGASLLNIFIVNFKNTTKNSKLIIYLLSVIQILFKILLYWKGNDTMRDQSLAFPLVGIWTGLGIAKNDSKNLGVVKNLLLITSICMIPKIHIF